MNKSYVYLGLSIAFTTILLGILLAILNIRIEYVVCDFYCTEKGQIKDCYIVSQKIGDYLFNTGKEDYKEIGGK